MEIELPEVVAEVRAEFDRYEQALVSNDVAALDAFLHDDPRTIRYGATRLRRHQGVPRRTLLDWLDAPAVEDRHY